MESSHQNKILHWCRNVWVYHVLNFVNANSSQILKGPKPGTPHVINVHGFTLNKIYQKQKQKQKQGPLTFEKTMYLILTIIVCFYVNLVFYQVTCFHEEVADSQL